MENASFSKVRLESSKYSTPKAQGILTGVFMLAVLVCAVIGILGPDVYDKKNYILPSDSLNVTWTGSVSNMERWHQRLFLQMRLLSPYTDGRPATYHQTQTITTWGRDEVLPKLCVDGCMDCNFEGVEEICQVLAPATETDHIIRCKAGDKWCGWDTLLKQPFVEYAYYDMQVDMVQASVFTGSEFMLEFEIVFITKAFTKWEMRWFYALCALTLCFMFLPKVGFFTEMRKLPQSMWSRQQVWVGALLVTLLLFNNIFFVLQILSPVPQLFFDLYVVQLATFLSLMLFFWLEMFSDLANGDMQGSDPQQLWERNRRKALKEYAPKMGLIFCIWLSTILVYTFVRVKQGGDPSHASADDFSSFAAVKIIALVLAVVYFSWLLVYMVRTFRYVKRLMPGYRFVLIITLLTVAMTLIGMATGDLAPSQPEAWPLATFSGLYNMYVLTLAWCYTPEGNQYAGVTNNDDAGEFELRGPEAYDEAS
eukprot:TRINITY_DN22864_c0_g1_i1.p1 TRINITY_DN22864_c0_g1~~TRINITY_DN22864_c0_g1_i1.p1  ORF type:complete len:480 (+),score=185.03 TRINITY_DN22864_c0_g1_i1:133-1572(+)